MKWSQIVFLSEELGKNKQSIKTYIKSGSNPQTETENMMYLKLEGPAYHAYREMIEYLKLKAMKQLNLSRKEIIVRALRPEDLGLSLPKWTFDVTADQWNTMVDTTVARGRYICINGLVYLETSTQAISQIRVTRMGRVANYWNIQGVILCESPYAYLGDPVNADQSTNIKIEGYATSSNSTEEMGFLGSVVERRGLLINP